MLSSPAQQALVATWFLKAIHAWEGYRRAFEQHRRMVDELKQQLVPYADGAFAITRARPVEALLLDDYLRKLRAFTKLQQSGEIPPQEDAEDVFY